MPRHQYNGKEVDAEGLGGGGATYDYGFRIYNPNIARFLSIDPLSPKYPWYTPYQFAGNNPIKFIDIDGLEEGVFEIDNQEAKLATVTFTKVYHIITAGQNAVNPLFYEHINTEVFTEGINYSYQQAPAEEMYAYMKNITFDENGEMHYEITDEAGYNKSIKDNTKDVWKIKVKYNIKVVYQEGFTEEQGKALVAENANLNGYIIGWDGPRNVPGETAIGDNVIKINNNKATLSPKILANTVAHEIAHGLGKILEEYYVNYKNITHTGIVKTGKGKDDFAEDRSKVQINKNDIEKILDYGSTLLKVNKGEKVDRVIKKK